VAPECGYESGTRKRIKPLDLSGDTGAEHQSPFNRISGDNVGDSEGGWKPAAEIRWLAQRRQGIWRKH
jgi:hypothetical protein